MYAESTQYQRVAVVLFYFRLFQADDAAEKKKRRTFRKYSYRGVDLDQLLDMSR